MPASNFAGHSHWANIKQKKARTDIHRSSMFQKIARELSSAVKLGGVDVNTNPRLVTALSKAKAANFPKFNIDAAINKAYQEKGSFQEVIYEGYGPGGVAILVESLTDNRSRTANNVKFGFTKHGGNVGAPGTVSFLFDRKGIIAFKNKGMSEDELMEIAMDASAEDMVLGEDNVVKVVCDRNSLIKVKRAVELRGFECDTAEYAFIPNTTVQLKEEEVQLLNTMVEDFENFEDVQQVHHNYVE